MARLLIHVEGQTEESFVNEVLRDYLLHKGYESVSARIMGNARLRRQRGGITPWPSARKEIINHLRQDLGCIVTTMVDYYGLPQVGDGAWPGRAEASRLQANQKAAHVEDAMRRDLASQLGDDRRIFPFVVIHEFEGLLFSDCAAFSRAIGRRDVEPMLKRIRDQFDTPEDINDSPVTAPSKRVAELVQGYEKPFFGTLAVLEIGLDRLRSECPHFNAWIDQLEQLV
jgi:hypothetical protein